MSQSILIAGGAGYIGSHTAKYFKRHGYEPVVLDNLVTGNRFALRFGPFYEAAIDDDAQIGAIVAEHGIEDAVFFAAHAYVGESIGDPAKYLRNNVSAALAFLEAIRLAGIRRLIFSSSCSVYGIQAAMPIVEQSPTGPLSPYAESKLFFEQALRWYGSAYGLRSVSLRYFNAAGADPTGEIGESHDPETHLIPLAIYAALGSGSLQVFGSDYPTLDGTAVRDYVHVNDLADGHLRALRYLRDGGDSTIINLGAGTGTSVRDIIRTVETVSGRPVPHRFLPRRPGDAPALVADHALARSVLGWQAQASSIENIIGTAWNWHSRFEKRLASGKV